jgi:hypothetical protein
MNSTHLPRDLVVLAADKDIEYAVRGVLSRPQAIGIRPITYDVFVHQEHDPGCRSKSQEVLRSQSNRYARALVIFDRQGCGKDAQPRESLELKVEADLAAAGWRDRCAAITIDPELEAWVWSDSPEVDSVLGWAQRNPDLRNWLRLNQFLAANELKPTRPKEAMRAALRLVRKPPSAALFHDLALRVSFARCTDAAFNKFLHTLRSWFSDSLSTGTSIQPK